MDVRERVAADKELAATYRGTLDAAVAAETALREAQASRAPYAELRTLSDALNGALLTALHAAEAAERAAMGPKAYAASDDPHAVRAAQIAARKARAKSSVAPWTGEVDRLRTARETLKLSYRAVARL